MIDVLRHAIIPLFNISFCPSPQLGRGLDWTGLDIYMYTYVYIMNENEKTRQWQSNAHNLCPPQQYEKIRIRWGVTNTDRSVEWIQTPEGEEAVDWHLPMYRPHLPSLLAREDYLRPPP